MKRSGAVGLVAAVLCATAAAATTPIFSTVPLMYITYSADCTFTFTVDGGITVDSSTAPGAQIPPGSYQLQIRTSPPNGDFTPTGCAAPIFQLTGPGVNYSLNLLANNFGGELQNETFQPGATYVADDASHPSQTQHVFTTATTGTSSSLLPPPVPDTANGGSKQAGLIGSAILPFRGTLRATVDASSHAALVDAGKPVAKLKAGRYSLVVQDRSLSGGFFVEKRGKKPLVITGASFVGTRSVKVDLTAGTWTFSAGTLRGKTFAVR